MVYIRKLMYKYNEKGYKEWMEGNIFKYIILKLGI